jgi:5-methylcytosine-specific restriction endonuclease McrA
VLYACRTCGTPSDQRRCPRHRTAPPRNPTGGRSPGRDRTQQARFRQAILTRDGYACQDCGATQDLRACHIVPLADGGSNDVSNGICRCASCDKATDPYAR